MAEAGSSKPARGGKRATPKGHVKVFKTAVFKIHNPSRRKRAMMMDSMKRAHLAYEKLLTKFMPGKDEIEKLSNLPKLDRREAMKPLTAQVVKASRYPQLSNNAKDAIRVEALAQISSTVGLQGEQEEVGTPTVSRINARQSEYEESLKEIMAEYEESLKEIRDAYTLDDEKRLRDQLNTVTKPGVIRPLGFARSSKDAGFVLFRHPGSNRYYAWLNLHSRDSRFAKPEFVRELVNLKTGEIVSFRSATGALFPLEMGHAYHDLKFIQRAEPQTSRLYHRTERNGKACDDFELHVTFMYVVPKRETTKWLGIDRGIYNLAAYSVVSENGLVVATGAIPGMELRHVQRQLERRTAQQQKRGRIVRDSKRKSHADQAVHVTANEIVAVASRHGAQVVLEDLKNLSGIRRRKRIPGSRRGGFNKLLSRVQYEKLRKVLEYKLKLEGLPSPIFVRPAYTSQTCPECSTWSEKNRKKQQQGDGFKMDEFACINCGHEADADENAARVIAMKGRWLTTLPRKSERKGDKKLPDSLTFEQYIKDCAERRKGPATFGCVPS